MIDNIDALLDGIGYRLMSVGYSQSIDQVSTCRVSAYGLINSIVDRQQVLQHLIENNIQVIDIDICINRVTEDFFVLGQKAPIARQYRPDEVTLEFTCYEDTAPTVNVSRKKESSAFKLKGAL